MSRNSQLFFVCILLSILFITTNCISIKPISYQEDINRVDQMVQRFHQLLNDEQYEELYSLTDSQVKATKSKETFILLMKKVRSDFGNVLNSIQQDTKVIPQASTRVVEILYKTRFENDQRNEKFVWIVGDNSTGLFSYEVQ